MGVTILTKRKRIFSLPRNHYEAWFKPQGRAKGHELMGFPEDQREIQVGACATFKRFPERNEGANCGQQ